MTYFFPFFFLLYSLVLLTTLLIFLPNKFPSCSHLSFIGIAGINMGGGYLLDYEQLTSACGYTTEENDSPSLNRHWLSIATQDRMDLMRPSSSHDEMLMNPIMCKRLLIYIGIHVLSLSDYEHFYIEHH